MANEVASLAVRIGADISGLRQGAKQASGILSDIGGRARAGASDLAKYGAAAAAAGVAVATALVNNARQAIDAQAKMAQQLDTTSASLATLKRAGELSGVEMNTITSAARTLSVRMGEAQQGLASAKDAFDKLGISAESLSSLPLDQRIRAINEAMIANVDVSERAAVAADLFGTRAATAMKMLSSGTLDQARKEAELFGLALSDVDAAKVEMANDALSTIGNAFNGIVQQFTVQLAPILKAIGDLFLSTAEDAGGMQSGVERAFSFIVDGAAFVMNAVDGIKRVFRIVADGVIASWSFMVGQITGRFASLIETIDAGAKMLGIDTFSGAAKSVRQFSDEAKAVASQAFDNINETLMQPLSGDTFKQFVADAQAAGEAAAEAAVKARESVNVVPMDSGRTDKEIADINKRLEAIRQANLTELEMIQEKFIAENEAIRLGLEERQITQEQAHELSLGASQRFSEAKLAIDQQRADEELRIEKQKEDAKRQILSQAFGGLTALMNSESRKMFEIGKAASISQAVVSTYTGMAKALELGWPLGPIAAGAIALNGFAQVANIRKQTFGGGGGASAGESSNTTQVNAANTPVAQQQQETSRNVYVRGVDPGQMFSGQQLIDIINEAQKDGAVIRVAS